MKSAIGLLMLFMLFPSLAMAGEIYGDIAVGATPIGPGTQITVSCPNRVISPATG